MRIAKIMFSGGKKPYEYFCNDASIKEGDAVFIEGSELLFLISD